MKQLIQAVRAVLAAKKSNGHFIVPYGKLRDDLADALYKAENESH